MLVFSKNKQAWFSSHWVDLLRILRPQEWVKNSFVLAPLIFSSEFLNPLAIKKSLFSMMLFCFAASSVYLFNDIYDLEQDKLHPKKSKSRPLARGAVSVREAWGLLSLSLAFVALSGLFFPRIVYIIVLYLLLNLAYTIKLKHEPVLDLFCIAIGFVLRVYAGAVALNVPVSNWMFITTLCLALYLAVIKRRQEFLQHGSASRAVLARYSVPLLDYYAQIAATGALVFYSMFVMSAKPHLVPTIPFVLFGLFRYAYLTQTQIYGESPTEALLTDKPLLVTVLLWIFGCAWLLFPAGAMP